MSVIDNIAPPYLEDREQSGALRWRNSARTMTLSPSIV